MRFKNVLLIVVLLSCQYKSNPELDEKEAGTHHFESSHDADAVRDSIIIEQQNQHQEWMVKTFYNLKQLGYNYKKTWRYIDSATKTIYRDSVPTWYLALKEQTDSAIREKKLYKRI